MLIPCTRCRRHIWIRDEVCRFCHAVVLSAGVLVAGCDAGEKPLLDQQMQAKRTHGRIHGVITDRNGAPLENVNVRLILATSQVQAAKTDRAGRYELDKLDPGAYDLAIDYFKDAPHGGEFRANYTRSVDLKLEDLTLDIAVDVREQYVAPPYGAPPARHRRV